MRLRMRDFKGFDDAAIDLGRPMTILIGKNGSGKSNAIEALEVVCALASGTRLHEISDVSRGGRIEVRGGLAGCVRAFQESFTLEATFEHAGVIVEYAISIEPQPRARIRNEHLVQATKSIFFSDGAAAQTGVVDVQFDDEQLGALPAQKAPADQSVLSRIESIASPVAIERARSVVAATRSALCPPVVLNVAPDAMRAFERVGASALARSGANLSSVLHTLSKDHSEGPEAIRRIEATIQRVVEHPIERIGFVETPTNDVLFGLHQAGSKSALLDARLLSDGTLRALAVLTAVETVDASARLILEEIDNGIHPTQTQTLMRAVWDAAARRGLHVICTTHNPTTLDGLEDEQLESVVIATYDAARSASRLVRLVDLPRADSLRLRGNLGDLVTRRTLERYLDADAEARFEEEGEEWLKALP